jgi:hypothetical protein
MSKDRAFFLPKDAMLNYTSNSKMNFIQLSYHKFTVNAIKTPVHLHVHVPERTKKFPALRSSNRD